MEIKINEDDLQKYVESCVNEKIDKLTDEVIREKVQNILFDRVDGIFSAYKHDIKNCVDRHVREIVQEQVKIDSSDFNKAVESISGRIATRLKTSIIESIACALMPYTEEDEE